MYLDIQCLHCLLRPHQERGPTVTVHSHLENTVGVCHGLRLHFIQWCCRSSPYKSAIGYNTIWKQWPQRDNALKTHMNRKAQSLIIEAVWDDVNRTNSQRRTLMSENYSWWQKAEFSPCWRVKAVIPNDFPCFHALLHLFPFSCRI